MRIILFKSTLNDNQKLCNNIIYCKIMKEIRFFKSENSLNNLQNYFCFLKKDLNLYQYDFIDIHNATKRPIIAETMALPDAGSIYA